MDVLLTKRLVTRAWLVSTLNHHLKKLDKEQLQCCGCRVKQIVPMHGIDESNWMAQLFDRTCGDECIGLVNEAISSLQRRFDVAW